MIRLQPLQRRRGKEAHVIGVSDYLLEAQPSLGWRRGGLPGRENAFQKADFLLHKRIPRWARARGHPAQSWIWKAGYGLRGFSMHFTWAVLPYQWPAEYTTGAPPEMKTAPRGLSAWLMLKPCLPWPSRCVDTVLPSCLCKEGSWSSQPQLRHWKVHCHLVQPSTKAGCGSHPLPTFTFRLLGRVGDVCSPKAGAQIKMALNFTAVLT